MRQRILVTGAAGFVGTALCSRLRGDGATVVAVVRSAQDGAHALGSLDAGTDFGAPLAGVDTVVHLAARVHVMNDVVADQLGAYRAANVDTTLALARQAAARGVRRFVFVSSLKVNGEASAAAPFNAEDVAAPADPYGQSKHEAECALRALAATSTMELVIVRPPLVYGPGVKANFLRLMELVRRGVPLPLASVDNRRSMVALDNLVDLLTVCCSHPNAAGHTFMVSDGHDLSSAQLVRLIATAMQRPARLLPVPPALLRAGATALGKAALAQRLLDSLQVDIAATCRTLAWTPPLSPGLAVQRCVDHFLKSKQE